MHLAVQRRSVTLLHGDEPRWGREVRRGYQSNKKGETFQNDAPSRSAAFHLRQKRFFYLREKVSFFRNRPVSKYKANTRTTILTVHFQLDHFPDTAPDAVARLTEVKSFSVFFHVLQQQRTIIEDFRVRSFPQLLVFTGFAPCSAGITNRFESC